MARYVGDPFSEGYAKSNFPQFRTDARQGSGIDTLVLLEQRLDIRIKVESVLSTIFDRSILLDWDSGRLIPKARRSTDTVSYRLDRDECHGLKELTVLLTHLFDDSAELLIVDEPELNLHPQYQAYFLEQVRLHTTPSPETQDYRRAVLITHSPYILDIRRPQDLAAILTFDLEFATPRAAASAESLMSNGYPFVRRLNAHSKQLFFADRPVFVEGPSDALFLQALLEARGTSLASAGSCIIDAGGKGEVTKYLQLCNALNKQAVFIYDLDSLFLGTLRQRIKSDSSISASLLDAGAGADLNSYCGELERMLTEIAKVLQAANVPHELEPLKSFVSEARAADSLPKCRVAIMSAIGRHRKAMASTLTDTVVRDLEGRRARILEALKQANIHVLTRGALESYFPSFAGSEYGSGGESKMSAVQNEIDYLSSMDSNDAVLRGRYGDLFDIALQLPAKPAVDFEPKLQEHLSDYIYRLQKLSMRKTMGIEQARSELHFALPSMSDTFTILAYSWEAFGRFSALIRISSRILGEDRYCIADESTNAAIGRFDLLADEEAAMQRWKETANL